MALAAIIGVIALRDRRDDPVAAPRRTAAGSGRASAGDLDWEAPLPQATSKGARARSGKRSVRVEAQLVAVTSASQTEVVQIETFNRKPTDESRSGRRLGDLQRIYVEPGGVLVLASTSPALAFPRVLVRVPDPPPDPMIVSVPSSRHPRTALPLALVVVDEESLRPIPGARLDWGDPSTPRPSVTAGADGRIDVASGSESLSDVRRRLLSSEGRATIHAGAHYAAIPGEKERWIWSPELEDLAAWAAGGPLRVRLWRTPAPVPLRRFRLVDSRGTAYADRAVRVLYPSFGPAPWDGPGGADGWRRTDAEGRVDVSMPVFVGIEVAPPGQPTFLFGVHRDLCPADEERTLSIPALAQVDVDIADLPSAGGWTWSPDLLGEAATPMDGIFYAGRFDPGVTCRLRAGASPFDLPEVRGEGGKLDPGAPSFRFPTYVGCRRRVYLIGSTESSAPMDRFQVGSFEVEPAREGVERRSVRWGELDH